MLPEELNKILWEEIENLLPPPSGNRSFYSLVREALCKGSPEDKDGKKYDDKWGLLPLFVYQAITGRYEAALPLGAGLELIRAAAEVFDDIEDADSAEALSAKYGPALALNTGSALLILAERAFTLLKNKGTNSEIIVNIINTINSYYITTSSGQHWDLSLTPAGAAVEDTYLKVIAMKTASTVECACHTGAMLAAANQETTGLLRTYGRNLGMAAQIANDIKGVTGLKDIRKPKITLPAIFALAQTSGNEHTILEAVFLKPGYDLNYSPEKIRDLLFSIGAVQYTTIKMELYKQQAQAALVNLPKMGINVANLQSFLE